MMPIKKSILAFLSIFTTMRAEIAGGGGGAQPQDARADAGPDNGSRKVKLRTVVATLVLLAALGGIAGGAFVIFGVYNVAATEQHTSFVYRLLHYAMKRSVRQRAADVQPPELESQSRIHDGFLLYRSHCQQCHGGPGVAPDPLGLGMRPEPINLAGEASHEWLPSEIYWVIKHGIKPTGMPAWQYRLSEEEMWDLTAFVKRLPEISPREYMTWDRTAPPMKPAPLTANAPASDKPGSAKAGKHALQQYFCVTCHTIPGVTGADKNVGPTLAGIANRKYIGGVLVNTPDNMMRWLRDPQAIDPLSGMPNLHIREQDIRDITAYLYTLRQ